MVAAKEETHAPADATLDVAHTLRWPGAATVVAGMAACSGSDAPLPEPFERPQDARRSRVLQAAAPNAAASLALPTPDQLMDWAQQNYPDLFPGTPSTQQYERYTYRFYAGSANYIGIADGRAYVLGPVSSGALLDVGALADFAALVATDYRVAKPASDEEAARFLLQAQFSATRAEIARLRDLGYAAWFDEQATAPASLSAWDWLDQRGYTKIDQYGYYGNSYQVSFALWYQIIVSPDAMRQRAALALSEFFVVTGNGVCSGWRAWVLCDYWDMLVANAQGNFRTLLGKVALHSATGQVLTVIGSQKANPATGQVPDENFARELMQLFTIGLYELNPDGTEKLDASGKPIETYDQGDVTALARVFTGYNLAPVPLIKITQGANTFNYPDISQSRLPMVCNPALHDNLEVRFLDVVIPSGTPPERKLQLALDGLFRHPNVGPFFSKQMIQRLVTSNPSPGYVDRVAAVFKDNGNRVRGDLKAVFRAILLDPEARGPGGLSSPTFGKLREPMVRYTQFARSFGMKSQAGSWKLIGLPQQQPLEAPNVFSFFRPGYALPGPKPASRQLLAPEFQIVDQVSVAEYVNWIRNRSSGGFFVHAPDIPAFYVNQFDSTIISTAAAGNDIVCQYLDELPLVANFPVLVRHLNLVLSAGQVDAPTCDAIATALRANFGASIASASRATQIQVLSWAITMLMSSAPYLIQK